MVIFFAIVFYIYLFSVVPLHEVNKNNYLCNFLFVTLGMDICKIKNLIFDFGGVLVDLDRYRCLNAFAQLGFPNMGSMLDAYCQQGLLGRLEEGLISPEEFCHQMRAMGGNDVADEEIWQAWTRFLVGIPTWKLEALIELRKHYPIYLLSNTNKVHWQHAVDHFFPHKQWKVEDYFDKIFLSYELHQLKPGEEIFRTVIAETGVLPEETLFIDDASANCDTARSLGIHTYQPMPGEDWRTLFGNML
jgi:putative hydrolase of the HAD superfamily